MRWSTPAIVGFAETAGFDGPGLVVAVAVALAGSDSDDLAYTDPAGDGVAPLVGLWQIPAVLIVAGPGVDLYDPQTNADAAYGLVAADPGGWAWSVVYAAGTWQARTGEASAAVAGVDRAQPATDLASHAVAVLGGEAQLSRLAGTLRYVQSRTLPMPAGTTIGA